MDSSSKQRLRALPTQLRQWLCLDDSLTKHLERKLNHPLKANQFFQKRLSANPLERHLSTTLTGIDQHISSQGLCREAILGTKEENWILARVYIPRHHSRQLQWVKNTSNQPIGRKLYKNRSTKREILYYDQLQSCQQNFGWPMRLFQSKAQDLTENLNDSLVRVSKVEYESSQFLITEIFLNRLIQKLTKGTRPFWSRPL